MTLRSLAIPEDVRQQRPAPVSAGGVGVAVLRPSRKMAATRDPAPGLRPGRHVAILGHPGGWPPRRGFSSGRGGRAGGCDPRPPRRMAATAPAGTVIPVEDDVAILGHPGGWPPLGIPGGPVP